MKNYRHYRATASIKKAFSARSVLFQMGERASAFHQRVKFNYLKPI
jgi:hypothetical protein